MPPITSLEKKQPPLDGPILKTLSQFFWRYLLYLHTGLM